jgi:molybdopterin synthase catalytic subunit
VTERILQGVAMVSVTEEQLDVAAHEAAVGTPSGGATVCFCGVVRDHDHARVVTRLEYQAHPSAAGILAQVAAEFGAEPEVLAVAVSHRVGTLAVGDVALVAAVTTAHRQAAFDVCARLVDEVKRRLPVWKRQVFDDGTDEWVNCP